MTRAILLTNLGSPERPDAPALRRYLNQFLMDRAVIDLPWPLRRLLVSLICATRPARSAAAYRSIWMDGDGSPLLYHSRALAAALRTQVAGPVAIAMRYGSPSFEQALDELQAAATIDELLVIPLYPQYARATTGTSLTHLRDLLRTRLAGVTVRFRPAFFASEAWLRLYGDHLRRHLPATYDHLLLSYHGLPEQHLHTADPTGSHCLKSADCCALASNDADGDAPRAPSDAASAAHPTCYRHQCLVTSQGLAHHAGVPTNQWSVAFQSRLGRQQWLEPATAARVQALAAEGVKRLVIACPAFVADNLETLEEIGIQARETFTDAGGEQLSLVPCLNADPAWTALVADWCTQEWTALDDPTHPYNRPELA